METLSALGWVAESGGRPSGRAGGRPARSYRFRGEAGVVVGVDIGLHKVVMNLSDLTGDTIARVREDTDPEMRWLARLEFLRARLDADRRGSAALVDDAVCILAGRRLAAGLPLSGRLHRGRRGGAGETSTLPRLGLEPALECLRWSGERLPGESDIEALARATADKDPQALAAVHDFARRLGPAIAALILAVDPELVVLAGGISPLADALVPSLNEQLDPITPHVPPVTTGTLGNAVVARGAVRIALDAVNRELLDDPVPEACDLTNGRPRRRVGARAPVGPVHHGPDPAAPRLSATEGATHARRNNAAGGRRG